VSSKHRLLALVGAGLTAVALAAATVGTASADNARRIQILDDCDPATFAFVPGGCVGDGDTTFSQFLAEVQATGSAEDWAFHPSHAKVKAGQTVIATNRGGEVHTFTCVKQFGGGVVDALNIGANKVLAIPCDFPSVFAAVGPTSVLQGDSAKVTIGSTGPVMYQCVIHPWMRTTLQVERS
jgi:plastocyanin